MEHDLTKRKKQQMNKWIAHTVNVKQTERVVDNGKHNNPFLLVKYRVVMNKDPPKKIVKALFNDFRQVS